MKANVKDKVKIINKMNDWSMEYQEGDIFTVESTWYGGVNVTSKTGVPLSLDEVEYEVICTQEETEAVSSSQVHKILFHTHTKDGLRYCINGAKGLLRQYRGEAVQVKIEILAEYEAILWMKSGMEYEDCMEELIKEGVKIYACIHPAQGLFISQEELSGCVRTVPLGAGLLMEKQLDGYVYVKY